MHLFGYLKKKILAQYPCCSLTLHEATWTVGLFFPEVY